MRRLLSLAALAPLALAGAAQAALVGADSVIGRTLDNLEGERAGTVRDLIVDVRDARVLYVIVEAPQRFHTLPIQALRDVDGAVRLDMSEAGELAPAEDPRLRRAERLIGQPLENPGDGRIGTISDIVFDTERGRVERVVVAVDGAEASFPPGVLAHGRFPPLTRWQPELPVAPSNERLRLHEHRWPRN